MTCKHCNEEVVKNTVKKSPAPYTYYPWKHAGTGLFGCFTLDGNPTGRKAQPKEEK